MTNCKCSNPLREGESECDLCILIQCGLASPTERLAKPIPIRMLLSVADVAKALRRAEKEIALQAIQQLVNSQARDKGLWFVAQTAPEGYLQQELRRLHAEIEKQTVEDE